MLNRTNRTLSANLNRLNLGTRSLALVAGVNHGSQTLRLRHDHPLKRYDSERVGAKAAIRKPTILVGDPITAAPSSPASPAWPTVAVAGWSRVRVAVEAFLCEPGRPAFHVERVQGPPPCAPGQQTATRRPVVGAAIARATSRMTLSPTARFRAVGG